MRSLYTALFVLTALGPVAASSAKRQNAPAEHWVATWATAQPLLSTTTLPSGFGRGPGGAQAPGGAQGPGGAALPGAAQGPGGPQIGAAQTGGAQNRPPGGPGRGRTVIPPSFSDQTIRMIVHTSIGGRRVRVQFSNAFSGAEMTIGAAHVALRSKDSATVPGSDRALTFAGKPGCVIRPGVLMLSDPVDMDVEPFADLAVSIYLPKDTGLPTNHSLAMHTTWVAKGDLTTAEAMPDSATTSRVYFWLSGVDVAAAADAYSIVALGDSITDGQGTTIDANRNWAARLAVRLAASKPTAHVAVLNEGVAGGQVLRDLSGVSALARFDRDVLSRAGVKWLIAFEGINDLNLHAQVDSADPLTSEDLIAGYRQMIERAHTYGIKVIGATITPAETRLGSDNLERVRNEVNQWIRTGGAYDAVVDFDVAVRSPTHPRGLRTEFDPGDHIHITDAGNQAMADAFELKVFGK